MLELNQYYKQYWLHLLIAVSIKLSKNMHAETLYKSSFSFLSVFFIFIWVLVFLNGVGLKILKQVDFIDFTSYAETEISVNWLIFGV